VFTASQPSNGVPSVSSPVIQASVSPNAILSTADFDASDVDFSSLEFGPAGATPIHKNGHVEDANGDGLLDLVSHYRTQETGIAFGDTEACITGELTDGTPFEGCDAVNTVPQTA